MQKAAADPGAYDVAFLFSTKWEPRANAVNLGRASEPSDARYFDFHHDLRPAEAARLLHGDVVWQAVPQRRVGRRPPLPPLRQRQPADSLALYNGNLDPAPRRPPGTRKLPVIWSSIFRRTAWASLILLLSLPASPLADAQNPSSPSDSGPDAAKETNGRLVSSSPSKIAPGSPTSNGSATPFPTPSTSASTPRLPHHHPRRPPVRPRPPSASPSTSDPPAPPPSASPRPSTRTTSSSAATTSRTAPSPPRPASSPSTNSRSPQPLEDSSQLARLFDIENAIAWKVARQIDPHFSVAEQTFLAASGQVRLSAFENYIRGISSTASSERIKRLQEAVLDEPNYAAALLALGKAQYADRAYTEAAATLAKMPKTDRRALEANFYLGLARFNSAKYADAESAFAFVAGRLPLPEVVNNQGVAASRQGKDAVALFQRASTADPNDADYHFNLAVAYLNRGDAAAITRELDTALKLRSSDPEAADLRARVAAAHTSGPGLKAAVETGGFEPLERIRRTYSEASFRQAAFQMDQMRAARLATLPPAQQATEYTQQGRDYLAQGLIPEAEIELQAALTANPRSEAAHAGLAQVREQSGDPDSARREANTSIQLKPNVPAYLVLARLDLQANHPDASAGDVRNALRLEPTNSAALGMKQALLARARPSRETHPPHRLAPSPPAAKPRCGHGNRPSTPPSRQPYRCEGGTPKPPTRQELLSF